jgi:Zn-finger nucleic acid-binding protein
MNCRTCGGVLKPVGTRNYFRCLYCTNFHFPEETGDGVAIVGGDSNFLCPVCEQLLTLGTIEGKDVCYCRNCRGFLANNMTFGDVLRTKRSRNAELEYVPMPFAQEELQRRVKCPGCRNLMDTHPYHAGGNAVIDTCHRCHLIWLDAGELTVLGKYPDRSGLPRFASGKEDEEEENSEDGSWAEDYDEESPRYLNLLGFRIRI